MAQEDCLDIGFRPPQLYGPAAQRLGASVYERKTKQEEMLRMWYTEIRIDWHFQKKNTEEKNRQGRRLRDEKPV